MEILLDNHCLATINLHNLNDTKVIQFIEDANFLNYYSSTLCHKTNLNELFSIEAFKNKCLGSQSLLNTKKKINILKIPHVNFAGSCGNFRKTINGNYNSNICNNANFN
jgi:hypothetical protein